MTATRGDNHIDKLRSEKLLTLIMMADHNKKNDLSSAAVTNSATSPITAPRLDQCDGEETTACLSALVESSISSLGEDDSVNSSISSMEDEDEDQEPNVAGPHDIAVVKDDENSRCQHYSRTSTLRDNRNDANEEQGGGKSRCSGSRFLLARMQADASLFIASLVLGTLTVCSLWMTNTTTTTNMGSDGLEYGWFADVQRRSSSRCGRTKGRATQKFPSMELLGISLSEVSPSINVSNAILRDAGTVTQTHSMLVEPPYSPNDFQYDTTHGRKSTLPYWDTLHSVIEQTQYIVQNEQHQFNSNSSSSNVKDLVELWSKFSSWGPCYPRSYSSLSDETVPSQVSGSDWAKILQINSANGNRIEYPTYKKTYPTSISSTTSVQESLGGLCRPSFLIIGQGKCGTSSLYHYLTGHPRILPAKEKQIDYFRYHPSIPISWYYSHFPTIESFLGRGALMTGEASPGYMPYPSVVEAVVKRFSSSWKPSVASDGNDGEKGLAAWKAHVQSLPKIIAIVRNPIERAKSSYKYNYVETAIKKLRAGLGVTISGKRIPGKQTDQYYRTNHLFSFEELANFELEVLKECLKAGGKGENWTYTEFGKGSDTYFYESIQRRNNRTSSAYSSDTPPLIHLDKACYVEANSKSVLRVQLKQLAVEHHNKFLALPNWPLTRRILGRGVYALPLEWWYEVFSYAGVEEIKRIHVVCTEDLAETPGRSMDDVTKFLGLPKFDYTNVTNVGRYNVGGHRGYDTITKSQKNDDNKLSQAELLGMPRRSKESSSSIKKDVDPLLSISDELMNELVQFYHPYNERLFHLIGKRCPW